MIINYIIAFLVFGISVFAQQPSTNPHDSTSAPPNGQEDSHPYPYHPYQGQWVEPEQEPVDMDDMHVAGLGFGGGFGKGFGWGGGYGKGGFGGWGGGFEKKGFGGY